MASRVKKVNPEEALRRFLSAYIPGDKRRLLVAVSGGCDSMALLAAAQALSGGEHLQVYAAHLIHHPNLAQARSRAKLVAEYCRERSLPLLTQKLKSIDACEGSPEERMRGARYRFLKEAAQKFSCDWIMTGHHADDQAETILLRVLAGTGVRGLMGIQERRGVLLRPFLSLSKADLLKYCQENEIPFADDPANLDLKIPRNRMRLEVLPFLREKVNPDADAALLRLGRWAVEADEVISREVERCWEGCRRQERAKNSALPKAKIVLDIEVILTYFKTIRKLALLKAMTQAAGMEVALDAGDLDRADDFLRTRRTGAMLELPGGIRMVKHRRELIITAGEAPSFKYRLVPGRNKRLANLEFRAIWEKIRSAPFESGEGWIADMDLGPDSVELILRPAQEGDRFYPLGAPGEKRLFRFLTDRGVSRLDKRRTWVLERDGEIIWVVGHRISQRVSVSELGEGVWRLKLQQTG